MGSKTLAVENGAFILNVDEYMALPQATRCYNCKYWTSTPYGHKTDCFVMAIKKDGQPKYEFCFQSPIEPRPLFYLKNDTGYDFNFYYAENAGGAKKVFCTFDSDFKNVWYKESIIRIRFEVLNADTIEQVKAQKVIKIIQAESVDFDFFEGFFSRNFNNNFTDSVLSQQLNEYSKKLPKEIQNLIVPAKFEVTFDERGHENRKLLGYVQNKISVNNIKIQCNATLLK